MERTIEVIAGLRFEFNVVLVCEQHDRRPHTASRVSIPNAVNLLAVNGDGDRLALEGVLDIRTLTGAEEVLKQRLKRRGGGQARALDLGNLSGLDTPGALFLCGLREKGIELTGIRAEHKALLDLICALKGKPLPKSATVPRWR